MFRRLRALVAALAFAALGAVLGRMVARMRRQAEAGEPLRLERSSVTIRLRDLVPGLLAALRVRQRPWSYLHLPSWLAAFSVNFAFGVFGRELGPVLSVFGGSAREDEDDVASRPSPVWSAENAGTRSEPGNAPSATDSGFRAFSE